MSVLQVLCALIRGRAGLEEVKCEIIVKWGIEYVFYLASPMCSHWIREQAAFAEVWRWCHLRYLPSRANADTCEASDACNPARFTICSIFSIEQVLTMLVFQQWAKCCTCLHSYTPFLCRFLMKSNNISEPTHCFVLAGLISGFCPTFSEILYLSWERLFINIPLIFSCTAP